MSTHMWRGRWYGMSPQGDAHQRAREVVRPTGTIVRGKFPSRKNGRMVDHEGLLELDAIYLFECSPEIVRYREQPLTLTYPDGHRLRRYTPDFELVLRSGEIILVEIKPTRSLVNDEVQHKLAQVAKHLAHIGQRFAVLTEQELRMAPRQSNLRWVYHQTDRVPVSAEQIRAALTRYQSAFPLSISTAIQTLAQPRLNPFNMLVSGWLYCPLDQAVSPATHLHLIQEENHVWFRITQEHDF